jgi:nucleoid DNA-binding protein
MKGGVRMYLTRREILDEMNLRKYGLGVTHAARFLHDFFQVLRQSMCRTHKSYREKYFGAWKVAYWPARRFTNHITKKTDDYPASFRLRFAASSRFKKELNKK